MRASEVARSAADVSVALPRFPTASLYRHWHLRWGATDTEVAAAMPGDEIVPEPSFSATRAITIQAPPAKVWPWIVQIGTGRAGFYSYDLFDNAARPSADCILPQCQNIRVGDWVPMSSKVNQTGFKVKAFQPNQWLLWAKPHSTRAWQLTPIDGGGTRLVTRLEENYDWRSPGWVRGLVGDGFPECLRHDTGTAVGRPPSPPASAWAHGPAQKGQRSRPDRDDQRPHEAAPVGGQLCDRGGIPWMW